MPSSRLWGAVVILAGAIMMGITIISANAQADQLGDPFVGHFTKHTIRYVIVAAGVLFSGGILVVLGGGRQKGASAAR